MEVSVHEFKKELSRLLAAVEKGEKVVITRYGRPVVELRPASRVGGFDFSPEDPDRVEFGLDGPPVGVDTDSLDSPTFSRAVLGLDDSWHPGRSSGDDGA